jgi:D-alanyl-D-alanine carboxypeptidase
MAPLVVVASRLVLGLTASTGPPVRSEAEVRLTQLVRNLVAAGVPGVIVRVDDGRGRLVGITEQASWTR